MTEEILELWKLIIIGLVILPILLPVAAQKRKKSFTVARSGASTFFCENPLPYSGLVGDGKSFLECILFYR